MIRIVRRVQLLTVLALLLSGLFQPLAAAQGMTCSRMHPPADVVQQTHGPTLDAGTTAEVAAPSGVDGDHDSHSSQPAHSQAPSAPCVTAAIPAKRDTPIHVEVAGKVVFRSEQIPACLSTESLFRPPRLS
ncbi:MAG TPA: hypothetical protein VFI96_03480 [Longimicrobiaceae bacterium]|nr:hypothetical protein [Longimicrobiaceae bacterium]